MLKNVFRGHSSVYPWNKSKLCASLACMTSCHLAGRFCGFWWGCWDGVGGKVTPFPPPVVIWLAWMFLLPLMVFMSKLKLWFVELYLFPHPPKFSEVFVLLFIVKKDLKRPCNGMSGFARVSKTRGNNSLHSVYIPTCFIQLSVSLLRLQMYFGAIWPVLWCKTCSGSKKWELMR